MPDADFRSAFRVSSFVVLVTLGTFQIQYSMDIVAKNTE
jgi:hypothetical protein